MQTKVYQIAITLPEGRDEWWEELERSKKRDRIRTMRDALSMVLSSQGFFAEKIEVTEEIER